ncbi:PPE family protein [Mycobacterium malmoense]|nr:PPE family protein [Mycobacterium malmoense]QZA16423.1 PPE family protein [Mycobacterium malmoense]UNB93225.1 PPE family protein [Mycobacterium malmoense]
MTAPIWMALPPEVHSALLSSGPGPGALLAAAGAWQSLSNEYATAAAELSGLLSAVQAGAWDGRSAQRYVAAHAPYLAWLAQASTNSAFAASQHEVAAAAYTTALAAMPTLPELALNHATHAVLVVTNFFGINTIPIALNEADYVRMWIQAATTMGTYQAVAGAAVAATPTTAPAPPVLQPGVGEASQGAADLTQSAAQAPAADSGSNLNLANIISELLQDYINFTHQVYDPIINFLQDPLGNTVKLVTDFFTNPAQALVTWGPFLFAVAWQTFSWIGASLTYPQILLDPLLATTLGVVLGVGSQLLVPAIVPAGIAAGGALPVLAAHVDQPVWAATGVPTTVATPAAAPASAGVAVPGPGAPLTASAAAPAVPYAVAGLGPDEGFTPTLRDSSGARVPAVGVPAAAAAVSASARDKRRARRRRRAVSRGYGDEFMDLDSGVDAGPPPPEEPSVTASTGGAGPMGFGGVAANGAAEAIGLKTLAGDAFGGGPTSPMLPGTWEPDAADSDAPGASRPR